MSYLTVKQSSYIGQLENQLLKDHLIAVDMDLDNLFRTASIFYQFGTGTNYSVLTYSSSSYTWYPTVGGWNITNTLLYGGSGSSYIGLQPTVGIWLGDAAFNNAVFSVDPTGVLKAHSGEIGGWSIGTTILSSSNLTLDSANERIETQDFVSGPLGTGWRLAPTLAEFQNVRVRGKITTSVFEKSTLSTIGGSLVVLDGDVLDTDMTTLDASTMTISGDTSFATGDMVRINDGTDDEWIEITGSTSAFTYTLTRDKHSDYGADANPIWTKGTSVVNYKQSGEGGILLTSSEANSPYIDFFTHSGSPWTDQVVKTRIGNLTGIAGASGYGIWAGSGYLADLDIIDTIEIAASGSLRSTIGGVYPYLELSNAGLQLKDSNTGGTYGTAVYGTDKYGYGALAWIMNSSLGVPWAELKVPTLSGSEVASMRLYNRSGLPSGPALVADMCVTDGKLYICTGAGTPGTWTCVGDQTA